MGTSRGEKERSYTRPSRSGEGIHHTTASCRAVSGVRTGPVLAVDPTRTVGRDRSNPKTVDRLATAGTDPFGSHLVDVYADGVRRRVLSDFLSLPAGDRRTFQGE